MIDGKARYQHLCIHPADGEGWISSRFLKDTPQPHFVERAVREQHASVKRLIHALRDLPNRLSVTSQLGKRDSMRSEERRGGKEWVSTCIFWWAAYREKKKIHTNIENDG